MTVNRKISFLIITATLFFLPKSVYAANPPTIQASAAILMDAKTGQVLYQKNMHVRHAPASTTKILTAILAIESLRLDDEVKVSPRAAGTGGSSMHLYAGQIISLRELVTGLMLRSGNDAAVAIAEHLAGSSDEFVNLMNQKARLLGAYNSQFRNPNGLSAAGHYSTAFDLAWMTRYALANSTFSEIVATRQTSIDWQDSRGREKDVNLRNTNKLLWMLSDADGVKTGTTDEAGPCLVSSATRDNQKLIAVVLHDHSRWTDSLSLLQYGFNTFNLYDYAQEGDIVAAIPVENGMGSLVNALVASQATIVVAAEDVPHVNVEVDLPKKINAPLYKGQKIGEIIFFVRDKPIKTIDIIAEREIEEKTPARMFLQELHRMFRLLSGWGIL